MKDEGPGNLCSGSDSALTLFYSFRNRINLGLWLAAGFIGGESFIQRKYLQEL